MNMFVFLFYYLVYPLIWLFFVSIVVVLVLGIYFLIRKLKGLPASRLVVFFILALLYFIAGALYIVFFEARAFYYFSTANTQLYLPKNTDFHMSSRGWVGESHMDMKFYFASAERAPYRTAITEYMANDITRKYVNPPYVCNEAVKTLYSGGYESKVENIPCSHVLTTLNNTRVFTGRSCTKQCTYFFTIGETSFLLYVDAWGRLVETSEIAKLVDSLQPQNAWQLMLRKH